MPMIRTIEDLYPAALADVRLDAVRVTRSATTFILASVVIGGGSILAIASMTGTSEELSVADFRFIGWIVVGAFVFACWKWYRFFRARRRMDTRQFGSEPNEAAILGAALARVQDRFKISGPNSAQSKEERRQHLQTHFLESAKSRE